jgi:hypothetical protein
LLREEDEDDEKIGADVFPCSGGVDGVHGEAAVDDGVAACPVAFWFGRVFGG